MKPFNNSETKVSIFSHFVDNQSKQVITKRMISKIKDKKREIKMLFLKTIGKFKEENKPLALINFEEGYRKYLFGEKGELTKIIPQLQLEYQRNRSLKSTVSSSKIKTGNLTYWNANLISNNFMNRINSVKQFNLSRSKFFSIDQHEVDLFHSHIPSINRRVFSSKSQRNINQTDLSNKMKTSPSMNYCFQGKQSYQNGKTICTSALINKSRKKYICFTPKKLSDLIINLDSKQNGIAKRLSDLMTKSKLTHQDDGNIKENELPEMEAVYDVKTKRQRKAKKKKLFLEAKKRQLQVTATQAVMIRLTDMIGLINAETANNCSENISREYEKLLSLYDNDILRDRPKLIFKSKDWIDHQKREKLELNYNRMKKIGFNITQSQNQALDRIVKFKTEIKPSS